MKGDYAPGTTATPLHVVLTWRPDGSINPSVGVVFLAATPSGTLQRRIDVEVPLHTDGAPNDVGVELDKLLRPIAYSALEQEGLSELTPIPEPEETVAS